MAWAIEIGSGGTSDKTSGNTYSISATNPAGSNTRNNVVFLALALDNLATTDVTTSPCLSFSESGQTWTRAGSFTNGQGAAAAGATVELRWSERGTATAGSLTIGSIAITFSGTVVAKGVAFFVASVPVGSTVALYGGGSPITRADDGADAGSIQYVIPDSNEYLFARAISAERAGTSWTPTSGFAATGGSTVTGTSGGSAVTNIQALIEGTIAIGNTGPISDPTTSAVDQASIMAAFTEVVPVTSRVNDKIIGAQQAVNRAAYFCMGNKWARRGRLWVPEHAAL